MLLSKPWCGHCHSSPVLLLSVHHDLISTINICHDADRGDSPGEAWYAELLLLVLFKTRSPIEPEVAFVRWFHPAQRPAHAKHINPIAGVSVCNDQACCHSSQSVPDRCCKFGVHHWPMLHAARSHQRQRLLLHPLGGEHCKCHPVTHFPNFEVRTSEAAVLKPPICVSDCLTVQQVSDGH